MPLITVPLPNGVPPFVNEERVREYFENNGVTTVQGMIVRGDGNVTLEVSDMSEAAEIAALVENYNDAPTQRETVEAGITADAKTAIQAIKNKGPNNWTTQDKIILAIAIQLRDLND